MPARAPVIAALGALCAVAAIAAGIYLGLNTAAPQSVDIPFTTRLLDALPLVIAGLLLAAVSVASMPRLPSAVLFVVLAASAVVTVIAVYMAVDIASNGDKTDETFFTFIAILTTFAPITAIAVGATFATQGSAPSRRVASWARFGGLLAIVLSAAYVLWFRDNRSDDIGGNWWFFLSLFAWGGGWGLALVAAVSPSRSRLQMAIRVAAAALVVFAVAYAWEADGGTDELLFFGADSLRIFALGLMILVLSGFRLSVAGIVLGIGIFLIALEQGLDLATLVVPGPQKSELVFLNRAAMPMAMGALLALLSATQLAGATSICAASTPGTSEKSKTKPRTRTKRRR